jgi:hypothetical protein
VVKPNVVDLERIVAVPDPVDPEDGRASASSEKPNSNLASASFAGEQREQPV